MNKGHIIKLKGRKAILPDLTVYYISAVLAKALLISSTPAFYSCDTNETTTITREKSGTTGDCGSVVRIRLDSEPAVTGVLDIFFFNNDKLKRLDSYQRLERNEEEYIETFSREGSKKMVIIGNSPLSFDQCRGVLSYDDLSALYAELKEESPETPILTYECSIQAGHERVCTARLEPLMSEIVINSICCDFHKKTYNGARLENVKFYLTNVCGRFPVTGIEPESPQSIINYGKLSPDDISGFIFDKMIMQDTDYSVGENVVFPECRMYCYQNTVETESLGTPFTRLVIEGTLNGVQTYYPININRGYWSCPDGSVGVCRNRSYVYDLTLTQRGVDDPDTPIEPDVIRCGISVKEWKEKENRLITY